MMNHQGIADEKKICSIRLTTKLILALTIIFQMIWCSAVHAQYQVDSVVHILEDRIFKTSQQIDHATNTVMRTYTSTDPKNNVQLESLRDFSQFNSDDKLILRSTSQWNTLIKDWEKAEKTEIEFDDNGRNIIVRESRGDDKDGWGQVSLDSVIYYKDSIEGFSYAELELATKSVVYLDKNENGNLSINYRWNKQSNVWDPSMKTDFEYRENGMIEESSTYHWKGGQWMPSEKTTYVLDNERTTASITYSGNEQGWQPEMKISVGYVEDQRMETDTTYYWSSEENRWNPEFTVRVSSFLKEERIQQELTFKINSDNRTQVLLFESKSTYNDQDQLIFYQGISYEDSVPISGDQQKYLIDEHGNIAKYTYLELDSNAFEWVEIMETDFTYRHDILWFINGQKTIKDIYSLDTYPLSDRNKNLIFEVKEYHFENGEKQLHEHVLYYYSQIKPSM